MKILKAKNDIKNPSKGDIEKGFFDMESDEVEFMVLEDEKEFLQTYYIKDKTVYRVEFGKEGIDENGTVVKLYKRKKDLSKRDAMNLFVDYLRGNKIRIDENWEDLQFEAATASWQNKSTKRVMYITLISLALFVIGMTIFAAFKSNMPLYSGVGVGVITIVYFAIVLFITRKSWRW